MDLFDRINQQQGTTIAPVTTDLIKGIEQTARASTIPQFQVNLTPTEQAIITQRMSLSDNPNEEKEKWEQAVLMSRQYGVSLEYAIDNLDSIVKYQTGTAPQFNQSFTRSLINSVEIGSLTSQRNILMEQRYWAEKRGEDTTEIKKQAEEIDKQIEALYDYLPRPGYQEILKGAAQSLAYTADVGAASVAGAALGNFVAPGLGSAVATVAAFAEGYRLTKYAQYYDLVDAGVDPTAAEWTSTLSGGIQAAIESLIGIDAGLGRVAAGGSANFVSKLMKNMYLNGTLNIIGLGASRVLLNTASEGIEEFLQKTTENIFTNIAYVQSGMDAPYTFSDTMKQSLEAFVQGAGAGLVLGVVGDVAETVHDVKYAKAMRYDALTTDSKQVFVEKHMEDDQLKDLGTQRRREALSQTYDNINTQYEEAIEGLSTAEARTVDVDNIQQPENVGEQDEEGNFVEAETSKELPELKRQENGRLRVQEGTKVVQMADGSEKHLLLIGSADNSSNRYGHINYTLKPDGTIEIDSVKTRSGYQSITADAVQELSRRYPGMDITWEPETEAQQRVKQSLLESSPTGKLNWTEAQGDLQERAAVAERISKAFTNLNKDESNVAAVLMELRAKAKGMTTSEYLDTYISEMNQEDLGKNTLGRTIIKGAKAMISAGKSANFSTFAHEGFHVIRNEMSEDENQRLASAFKEAVDTKSFKQFVAASRKVLQMDYATIKSEIEAMDGVKWTDAQEEIAARMFESYLLNGKTSNTKLADLFSKIAEFFRKIYGLLRGQRMLSDNIIKAYDSLFERSAEAQTATAESADKELFQTSPESVESAMRSLDSFPEEERNRIAQNLEKYKGTPWYEQTIASLNMRQDLKDIIEGRPIREGSVFADPRREKLVSYLRRGIDGVYDYLNQKAVTFIANPEKCINAVNSSLINCNPSADCAKFCYASGGNYRYTNSIIKSELVTMAIESNPVRAAKVVAQQYKATSNYMVKKALRIFDKGDFSAPYVTFVQELNKQGIATQIFSKRPEFLRQIDPKKNVVMLSIDKSNRYLAEQNPDLPIAMVYSGSEDVGFIEDNEERYNEHGGVILPVKLGNRLLSEVEIRALPQWARTKYTCPIDAGVKQLGEWNCQKCDINGTGGCFYKRSMKDRGIISQSIVEMDKEKLDGLLNEVIETALRVSGFGKDSQQYKLVLENVSDILRERLAGIDPETERTSGSGTDGYSDVRIGDENVRILNQSEYDEVESQYKNTDKWLKAPNGKPTNLTERQWVIVRTDNFKRWFGDWENDPANASKVVDENGEPLILHHGTMAYGFDVFNTVSTVEFGSHFGTMKAAEHILDQQNAGDLWDFENDGAPIYDVFLNIRNPLTGFSDIFGVPEWTAASLSDAGLLTGERGERILNFAKRIEEIGDRRESADLSMQMMREINEYLQNLGYDGMQYENGYEDVGSYSWIALNPNQIKSATDNNGAFNSGNNSILYQTEDEDQMLMDDARSMDRDEFLEYGAFMYDDYTEAQLNEIWNQAHGRSADGQKQEGPAITADMTDEQKDEEFIRYFESDDALRSLIEKLRDAYGLRKEVNLRGIGATSQEEYDDIVRDLETFDRFMREASPFFKNIISGSSAVSDTSLKNIRTTMENAPRMYRDLYAEITGDDSLKASVYDKYLPNIDEPGFDELRGMSISDRKKLSEKIENQTLKKKLLSGEEALEGEAEKVIKSMDAEIAQLEDRLKQMQSKNDEYYNSLNADEKRIVQLNEQIADAKHQIDELNRKIRQRMDRGSRIDPKLITSRTSIQEKLDLLNEQVKTLRANDRTRAAEQKREALRDLKEQIREKQAAKREAKLIHDYKQKLASAIVREVPNTVDFEYRQRIMAIQAMVDPNYRQNTIWYDGKKYTIAEFREYFRSLFEGVSDEELNDEIRRDYEAFGLTKKQADRLIQKNLNDFTVAELEDMVQQIADLKEEGRQVWQAKQDEKRRQARRLQNQIMAGIMARPHAKTPDELPTPGSAEDKKAQKNIRKQIRTGWFKTLNMDRKAQMLDNDEKGVAYDLLIRKRREVQANESKAKSARIDPVMKVMNDLGVKPQDLYKTVDITLNGKTEKFTYSDLYYGLAAQHDERNFRAFAYGTLVTIGEKEQLNNDNNLIEALGNAKNRQFVQQARVALEMQPNLVKVFEAMEADLQSHSAAMAEFSIREYNDVPAFQDYYLPIYRADFNGTKLAAQMSEDVKRQNPGKNASLPSMSRWKERIDISANNQRPVHLDYFSTWLETVEEVEHTIATLGYERDLKRVFQNFGSETLKSYIDANFGRGMLKDIDNYINEVGNPPVYNDVQGTEKTIRFLRGNLYSAYLGFKLSGVVLQAITSPAATLGYVNPFSLAQNLLRMTFNFRKTWDFVSGMSEFMKNRSMDPTLDIIKKEANTYTDPKAKRAYASFLEKGTMGLEIIDKWAVTASWMALYEKKLKEFEFQNDEASMKAAAKYADEIIAETQPLADPAELAPLYKSRSEFAKAFMQFTTSMNVIWNNFTYDILTQGRKKRTFRRNVGMLFGYAMAGALLTAVQKGTGKEDEPEDVVRQFLYGMTTQFTGSVPLFGNALDQLAEGVITGDASNFYGSNSIFPGIEDTLKGLTKLGESFSEEDEAKRQKKLETAMKNITKGVGLMAGVPTSAISELGRTFIDDEGFTFNPAALAGRRDK